jgi:hypothetical protein
MAIEKQINLNVNSNIEGSISELRSLKRELKNTAAGSEDFKKLYNQIDDLEDKIKSAKNVSSDWVDSLENVGGPLGSLGAGINKVKVSTQSFGAALKATGIGLIVSAVAGLAAAFSQNESAMKKLKPLTEAFEKILGGIFRALEPLIDSFMDLAMKALPYITQGIGLFYSGLVGLFTYVKEAGGGYIKMMKGIVTLDFDAAKEGFNQMKDSFNKAVKSGEDAYKRFDKGSKEQTKSEKEELAKRREEQQKHNEELAKKQEEANRKKKEAAEKAREEEKRKREEQLKEEKEFLALLTNARLENVAEEARKKYDASTEQMNSLQAIVEVGDAIEEEYLNKKKVRTASELEIDRLKYEGQTALAKKTSEMLGAFSDLLGKETAEGKALAIAQATINAYLGISEVWKAKNVYPEPYGTATKIASTVVIAASAFKTVKDIAAVNVPGGAGGGSAPSGGGAGGGTAPAAPSFNVVGTGGTNQIAQVMSDQGAAPVQAYVVASNVTSAQSLNRNIVNNATLG